MIPTAFAKTLGALDRASHRGPLLRLTMAVAVLAALAYWMVRVPVALYETSSDARLEIAASAAVVQAPMLGKVVEAHLELGQAVQAGDVLVRLDSQAETLQLRQEGAGLAAIQPEADGLHAQIVAEESASAADERASQSAIAEASLKIREAETPAKFAQADRQRLDRLKQQGLAAARDAELAGSEADRLENATATARSAIDRLDREQQARARQRAVRVAELRTQIAKLESTRAGISASIARITYDIERRTIRAPISGIIGEATVLRPGSVVQEGARVASIVATGHLRIVASFPPQAAYGRMPTGARARLRLTGYPWTEFGVVEARVAIVAGEDHDGKVRVELDVLPSPTLKTALRHGMPGELEVEVERTTPLALVLRTAGQWLNDGSSGPNP